MALTSESACVDKLKALADPIRLAVIEALLPGPKCVAEINASVRAEPTLLSHHLKTLREAGLVVATREGKTVRYRLAPGVGSLPAEKIINLGCCQLSFD